MRNIIIINCLFLLFLFSLVSAQLTLSPSQFELAFNNYVAAYGKSYATVEESKVAFNNFKINLETSMNANANLPKGSAFNPNSLEYGLHGHADKTAQEFVGARAKYIVSGSVAAAAVLSTAMIAVIAVAGSAVIAGAITGVVLYQKRKAATKETPAPVLEEKEQEMKRKENP